MTQPNLSHDADAQWDKLFEETKDVLDDVAQDVLNDLQGLELVDDDSWDDAPETPIPSDNSKAEQNTNS